MSKHRLNPKTFALFTKLFIQACREAKTPKEVFLKPADKQRLLDYETSKVQPLDTSKD